MKRGRELEHTHTHTRARPLALQRENNNPTSTLLKGLSIFNVPQIGVHHGGSSLSESLLKAENAFQSPQAVRLVFMKAVASWSPPGAQRLILSFHLFQLVSQSPCHVHSLACRI